MAGPVILPGAGGSGISQATLKNYVRAFDGLSSGVDIYVDNDAGDDVSGDGSSGNPYASIKRGLLDTAPLTRAGVLATVHLANTGTPYVYPYGFADLRYVLIVGDTDTEETRNITSVSFQSNNTGCAVIVDGATLTDDEWAGRVATVGGKRYNITRNVGNTVYGYRVGTDGWNSNQSGLTTGTFALLSRPSIEVTHDLYVSSCYFLEIQDVDLKCPNLYLEGANHIDFYSCGIYTGNFGVLNSTTVMLGTQVIGAKIDLSSGAWMYRANCSFLGLDDETLAVLSGANRPEIVIRNGAYLADWYGGVIHRNIQGVYVMGGLWQNYIQANTMYCVFDNQVVGEECGAVYVSTREPASEGWPYGQGSGGTVKLMKAVGTVDGEYFIEASGGAQIMLDADVDVSTDGEANAVSADGGQSLCSWNADGTSIIGGTPAYMPGHQAAGPSTDDGGGNMEAGRICVYDGSNWVMIAADDNTTPVWESRKIAVAAGDNAAAGMQLNGEVVISANILSGTPGVGDPLYVATASATAADYGKWTTTAPSTSGELRRVVGYVQQIISGSPVSYRVLLTPDSPTFEVA